MSNPKVSIVVPAYGVERYLNRCVESLINQSLKGIEIILVDDKSPDRVPEMCDEWETKDSRIKVIHKKKNEGLGLARNSGMEIASGEYIAFVDSDDYVELNMYEVLFDEAKKNNADVVYSNFFIEGIRGDWFENKEVVSRREWNGFEIENFQLDMIASAPHDPVERHFQMSVWHSIYKKDIIKNNGIQFYSERVVLSEDFPFQMDFLNNANKVVFLPLSFYHYCNNENSLTHEFNYNRIERTANLQRILKEKTSHITKFQERIDRFYIGYMRSFYSIYICLTQKIKQRLLIWHYNDRSGRKLFCVILQQIFLGIPSFFIYLQFTGIRFYYKFYSK